jgi:hypothetical protein
MRCFIFLILFIFRIQSLNIPFPFNKKIEDPLFITPNNVNYPVWPANFNCTLIKTNYGNKTITWTKLFYDVNNKRNRFDFYSSYLDGNGRWGRLNTIILFLNTTVWFIDPNSRSCSIRSRILPPISRHWLRTTTFNKNLIFRGNKYLIIS